MLFLSIASNAEKEQKLVTTIETEAASPVKVSRFFTESSRSNFYFSLIGIT